MVISRENTFYIGKNMKIIQITDLHIDKENENPFDIDVRKNLLDTLDSIRSYEPDHLVLTGDLCCIDGQTEIYQWIHAVMENFGVPYDVIAGNHDDSLMIAESFQRTSLLNGKEFYFAKRIGKYPCLFLDSSIGKHSKNQLNWLKRQLHQHDDAITVFMHHPPIKAGVPFMDNKHALQDMEEIQSIFFDHRHTVNVFCGHYHVEKNLQIKNLNIHITPSCFFQIDQREEDFKVDHHRTAFRLIELNNGVLSSTVRYLAGNKLGVVKS